MPQNYLDGVVVMVNLCFTESNYHYQESRMQHFFRSILINQII